MAKKSYYSNADAFAKKNNFTPDHSEFYPGSEMKDIVYKKSSSKHYKNQQDIIDVVVDTSVPGTAHVVGSTKKYLADSLSMNHDRYDNMQEKFDRTMKKFDGYVKNGGTMSQNMYSSHSGDGTKDVTRQKNMRARNRKTNRPYRTWQRLDTKSIKELEAYEYDDFFEHIMGLYGPQRKELPILSVITGKELDTAHLRTNEDEHKKAA